jgi:gas vesicle protein
MSTGKVLIGTLAGLAIGAIAGILFAPEKGSVTRKQILSKGEGYVDDLKSKFDEFSDSIMEKFEATTKEAEDLAAKGKAKFEETKKELLNAGSDGKNTATSNYKS